MKPYRRLVTPQLRQLPPNEFWITVGLMVAIFSFEFLTPSQLIFGYLYTAPILLASVRLRRHRIAQITGIAIALTLLNLWIPRRYNLGRESETHGCSVWLQITHQPCCMNPTPLKVLLVEDDELFRLGLRVRLQQEANLEVVAEASDGETAIKLVETCAINVVLLDVGLPGIGGIETCCQLKQRYPKLPLLVLTSYSQPALIARLIASDVQGYCVKGIAAETLILALQSVAWGASWWDASATQTIQFGLQQAALSDSEPSNETHKLTQREQEVLALIATGKSNSEIAQVLYITPGTVRVHVHAILHKLGVRDHTQAVIFALQNHWIASNSNG